ncbi:MAG TPA: hypothetical protein VEQ60_18230 [Longimicrobium sp.]|nr:hypothetical protein [Longimicrobium sp.]
MTMHRTLIAVLVAASAAAAPTPAAAQQRFGPSVDASFGLFVGGGGTFEKRDGPALDGIVAVPLVRTRAATVVAGVTAGISGPVVMDRICGPNALCVPNYPEFVTAGAVAGVQRALGGGLSARVLAGPAYFQATDGGDTMGMQGRLDVAAPVIARLAIVAAVRGSLLRYEGEALRFATFGFGLRIQ